MTETSISLDDLLARSESLKPGDATYSNHIQVSFTQNEIFLDFYLFSPISGKPPQAAHVARLVMGHNQMKGLAEAIVNLVDRFEKDSGIVLPNLRELREGERGLW